MLTNSTFCKDNRYDLLAMAEPKIKWQKIQTMNSMDCANTLKIFYYKCALIPVQCLYIICMRSGIHRCFSVNRALSGDEEKNFAIVCEKSWQADCTYSEERLIRMLAKRYVQGGASNIILGGSHR